MANVPELLPISSARSAGERLGLRSVIVMQELPDGRWGFTSWGKTRPDCQRARRLGDSLLRDLDYALAVEDGKI